MGTSVILWWEASYAVRQENARLSEAEAALARTLGTSTSTSSASAALLSFNEENARLAALHGAGAGAYTRSHPRST